MQSADFSPLKKKPGKVKGSKSMLFCFFQSVLILHQHKKKKKKKTQRNAKISQITVEDNLIFFCRAKIIAPQRKFRGARYFIFL